MDNIFSLSRSDREMIISDKKLQMKIGSIKNREEFYERIENEISIFLHQINEFRAKDSNKRISSPKDGEAAFEFILSLLGPSDEGLEYLLKKKN